MKTIAITIDDDTLARVDRLAGTSDRRGGGRSRLIRQAVQAHVRRLEQEAEEAREAGIVRRHRGRLAQEARALVRQQAEP